VQSEQGKAARIYLARELIRGGASQTKIMVGGGVASDFDPLKPDIMSEEEIRAIVDAAANFVTYACAHAYTRSQ
jgi:imidazolonepropionase-like amidohydrolase